jgi:hypothetical protein
MNKLQKLTVAAFLALNCLAFFGAAQPNKVNEYEGQHRVAGGGSAVVVQD